MSRRDSQVFLEMLFVNKIERIQTICIILTRGIFILRRIITKNIYIHPFKKQTSFVRIFYIIIISKA